MTRFKLSKRDMSILCGNALDHFDTSLYGFLAPLLAPLFFPSFDSPVQLLFAYGMLGTSALAGPLGVLFFGKLAARKGPVVALSLSLWGVAVTTFLIGCLPTYQTIGWQAPLALLFIRIAGGIFSTGESTVAKLYILDHKTLDKALDASYLYQSSTVLGIILASLMATVLSYKMAWQEYWRIPFLIGGLTGFMALYLRNMAKNNPMPSRAKVDKIPWTFQLKNMWQRRGDILRISIVVSFSYMTYSVPFVFMNSFIPLVTGISLYKMMRFNTMLLVLDMVIIPVIGHFTRRYPPYKIMGLAVGLLGISILPLFWGIKKSGLVYVTGIRMWVVILGLIYVCPLNVWLFKQFTTPDKYMYVGIGSALGSATLGRFTPALCLFLWHATGQPFAPAYYIIFLCFLTGWALRTGKK